MTMKLDKLNANDYAWDILRRNGMDVHATIIFSIPTWGKL